MDVLKQRSSWPSSILTGLIGWNGFLIIVALAFGYPTPPSVLFLVGTLAAVVQVVALRLLFFVLKLDRGLAYGAVWGAITAALIFLGESVFFPQLGEHFLVWFLTAVYIGPAVGAFLSYFYRDDQEIEAAATPGQPVDYGRDGHWLEPFVFGAVAYLWVFMPRTADLALAALVVGAMSGVFAAGASHFVLFSYVRRTGIPFLIGLVGGAVQGALTGLLFRGFADSLWGDPIAVGTSAGVLTYLLTLARGHSLACEEADREKAEGNVSTPEPPAEDAE